MAKLFFSTRVFSFYSDFLCGIAKNLQKRGFLSCRKTPGLKHLSSFCNVPLGFLWQECFTYVLKGHIAVSAAVFPTGTKGRWFLLSYGRLLLDQAPNVSQFEWKNMSFVSCPPWPLQAQPGQVLHGVNLLDPLTELSGPPREPRFGLG